jgi:endogenous inhibitor of DNA gyrase (YacG/DUF329 family)
MPARAADRSGAAKAAKRETPKCVICGKPRAARYDPFCSKRCADVDLLRWLKGSYVIPGGAAKKSESEDEE